jgi:predicted ABC-type ATPase
LTYLWLDSPNTAIERVAIRVQQGGHHIPKDVIIRRYRQGLHQLLHRYLPVMDVAFVVDGSSNQPGRPVIARKELGRPLEILNNDVWQRMVTYE